MTMKRHAVIAVVGGLLTLAGPGGAQTLGPGAPVPVPVPVPQVVPQTDPEAAPDARIDEGTDLVEQGMKLLLRGILDEMGTSVDEMQQGLSEAAKEIGPALRGLLALIDDVQNYEAPERLPNGDVILRRKPGAPPPPDLPQAPGAPGGSLEGGAEAIEL